MNRISDDYIAGFVDGEGCFALKYRADRKYNKEGRQTQEYHYWGAEFAIVLHPSDVDLLRLIQERLGVGSISHKKAGDQVRYSVQKTSDLATIIVPFFERNELLGFKAKDFDLWKEAVLLIALHQQRQRIGRTHPMDELTEQKLRLLKEKIDHHKRRGRIVETTG